MLSKIKKIPQLIINFQENNNFYKFRNFPIQYLRNFYSIKLPNLIIFRNLRKSYNGKIVKLPYPPKYVTIGILGYCMNACVFCSSHCIDSGRSENTNHQYNIPFSMKYRDFCKIVDMCYAIKVPHVHIVAAGEPFLHRSVFKMMDYIASKYLTISIQTNFSQKIFSNENLVENLLKRKKFINRITTDIFPPDVHNEIKKGSDYNFLLDCIEYLSKNSNILFDVHTILTKKSYIGIDKLILDLYKRKIKFSLSVVNLHPHNFNEFTSPDNIYLSKDNEILKELNKAEKIAKKLNLEVKIPLPWDKAWEYKNGKCLTFWSRFQIIPDKKVPQEKWIGNTIPSQCNAVITGNLVSLGNIFEYNNLMDFWNNDRLLTIRRNLIKGIYPDEKCMTCYLSKKKES